jgi:hypothetical protein
MILGTYWYFDYPTDLYKFDYFKFRKVHGGHFDNPAELVTTFETEHPERVIEELKKLLDRYSEGFLFIYQQEKKLKIGTGGYQLFDYDFLIIKEVEELLKNHKIALLIDQTFVNPTFIRINNDTEQNKMVYPKKGFLQVVGSELKKHNAENSKLRLDCNLNLTDKANFIAELRMISTEEKIDVLFYYDKDFQDKTNLMLFFTNGRQGLNLNSKKYIDTLSLESKIEKSILKFKVNFGHVDGHGLYPQNGPRIEKIIEQEYIL